ncbi:MAG: Uma2 family endonuclease [Gemmataceae bacterium]|nr:Uma2 family endonuclease [Gemmataceae bacterium]
MSSVIVPKLELEPDVIALPDDTQLPESDGAIVENFQEHPQSTLLTDTLWPVLQQRHPDGQFCIGQNSGIYWRVTDPPPLGCKAPDWFYVPEVPPLREGRVRRSYVLWREAVAPLIMMEFVSGNGVEEHDRTPWTGKFWVYEQGIRAPFYAIYEVNPGRVEVYHLVDGHYEQLPANERGHFRIADLGVELGIWHGVYRNQELPWLRWWDAAGNLLPTGDERAASAEELAARLAERLRALGVNPDEV